MKINVWRVFAYLAIISGIFSLDKDYLSLHHEDIHRGLTKVYVSFGSPHHNEATIDSIVEYVFKSSPIIECIDFMSRESSHQDTLQTFHRFNSKHKSKKRLFIINNLQALSYENVRELDFIFQATDKPIKTSHCVVVFLWNYHSARNEASINGYQNNFTMKNWKQQLFEHFDASELNFNGRAFVGRISDVFIDSSASPNLVFRDNIHQQLMCDNIQRRYQLTLVDKLKSSFLSTLWLFSLAVVLAALSVKYLLKSNQLSKKSNSSNEVRETGVSSATSSSTSGSSKVISSPLRETSSDDVKSSLSVVKSPLRSSIHVESSARSPGVLSLKEDKDAIVSAPVLVDEVQPSVNQADLLVSASVSSDNKSSQASTVNYWTCLSCNFENQYTEIINECQRCR